MKRNIFRWLSALMLIAILLSACSTPQSTPIATVQAEPTEAMVKPTATEAMAEPTKAPAPTATTAMAEPTQAPAEGVMLPEVDPGTVTGAIVAAGSSTVFPLTEAMANRFKDEGYADQITIDSIGSGAGFERFCKTGETDISNASRKINDKEVANCTAIGRTPIEFRVGTDAMAVTVSKDNDFLTDVNKEELAKIFSKDATKWSDVRAEWPNENILRYTPGTDSGTFDYFVEVVMNPVYVKDATADAGKGEEATLAAANLSLSEDDNILVQGVEGSPYAIGYFGFAYYQENQDKLKAISVNGVTPNEETAESNEYPLSRPLFIYSDAKIMKEKPQVAAFINFFLSYVNEEIIDVGYFPASTDALNAAKQAWLDAMK